MQITDQEINTKVEELKQDEVFMARLAEIKNANELAQLFSEQDMELSQEAAEKAWELAQKGTDELTEDELESVAGGFGGLLLAFGFTCAVALVLLYIALNGSKSKKSTASTKNKKIRR